MMMFMVVLVLMFMMVLMVVLVLMFMVMFVLAARIVLVMMFVLMFVWHNLYLVHILIIFLQKYKEITKQQRKRPVSP